MCRILALCQGGARALSPTNETRLTLLMRGLPMPLLFIARATLLKTYWDKPDGHVEAFYQYEQARRPHTNRIHQGSYKKVWYLLCTRARLTVWCGRVRDG